MQNKNSPKRWIHTTKHYDKKTGTWSHGKATATGFDGQKLKKIVESTGVTETTLQMLETKYFSEIWDDDGALLTASELQRANVQNLNLHIIKSRSHTIPSN